MFSDVCMCVCSAWCVLEIASQVAVNGSPMIVKIPTKDADRFQDMLMADPEQIIETIINIDTASVCDDE